MKRYKFKPRFYAVIGLTTLSLVAGSVSLVNSRCAEVSYACETDPLPTAVMVDGISAFDRDYIERVVAAEARGESYEGMMAVAQTIKDRGDLWGKPYIEIASKPYQFAKPYKGEISNEVKSAVSAVFDNNEKVFDKVLFFFNPRYANPNWAKSKTYVGKIGSHVFYS